MQRLNVRIQLNATCFKTLGASPAQILLSLTIRALLLGLAAGVVAIAAGGLACWAVSRYVLEVGYTLLWPSALVIVGAGVLVTLLTALVFAWRVLAARPAETLRARE